MIELPKDEMAFRQIYLHLLRDKSLTVTFRPRNMIVDSFRGYSVGDRVKAKVLKNVGADWAKIPPEFLENEEFQILITDI